MGRTSGLGEFWNLELAQKSFLLAEAAEAMRRRVGGLPWVLNPPGASDGELSSSIERLKTPSLGERTCWRLRSGVTVDAGFELNGNPDRGVEMGAVRGPSS